MTHDHEWKFKCGDCNLPGFSDLWAEHAAHQWTFICKICEEIEAVNELS